MKVTSLFLAFSVVASPVVHARTCGEESAETGAAPEVKTVAAAEAPARHQLVGQVVEVMPDQSALLVKHEEIPGVMKAMTMLLKVDEAALKAVKKGDAVTGLLVRKADGWWLEEVARRAPESKPAV